MDMSKNKNIELENYKVNVIRESDGLEKYKSYTLMKNKKGNTDIELLEFSKTPYKIITRKIINTDLSESMLVNKLLKLNLINIKQ